MNTEKTTYKGITLPDGFAPTKIDGEDSFDDGLVITDGYGNEYVWVEVPRTTTVYPTAGLNITSFTNDEYTEIENDLHTYTADYRNGTSYSDVYYEDSTPGWFADSLAYDTAKKKMLKSVYENGGFWVGRYEVGTEKNRTSSRQATTTPLSKANLYPYNYITRTQAKVLAEQVESGSYTSSLMFGVQWDLVLKYLEIKGTSQADLITNSTSWGNYQNNAWNITNENLKYVPNGSGWTSATEKTKDSSTSILLSTGASDDFSKQGIYDLAGNVWEWTLEKTSNSSYPCAIRGGSYRNDGGRYPAANRNCDVTTHCSYYVGFRVSLY